MKVLWFSNSVLANFESNSTGTWLQTMSQALISRNIEIYNITQSALVHEITYEDLGKLKQWTLPVFYLRNSGLPSEKNINKIVKIVNKVNPDIVHVWGTEFYWGLLTARGYIKGKIILDIEGLMFSCAKVFYGGLSTTEILKTIHLKELISFKRSIIGQKREFERWGRFEKEMLAHHDNISTQSDWVRAWIAPYSKKARIYNTGLIIRPQFYTSRAWVIPKDKELRLLAFSSGADSFKGLHIIIKALSIVKKTYPNVKLRLAGNFGLNLSSIRKPGYTKFILGLIKKLSLIDNVVFLGPLRAEGLVDEMLNSRVYIHASNVESYSMSLAESMAVGIPAVVSYAGAMPELAKNEESALFFPINDYRMCAYQIERLLTSEIISKKISENARKRSELRNTSENIVKTQVDIYNQILQK